MGKSDDSSFKERMLLGRSPEGRQKLLDRFVEVCNDLKADPFDVVSASLYICCIGVHDRMNLPRDVFLDMAGAFYDDVVEQRDEARDRLKEAFDAWTN